MSRHTSKIFCHNPPMVDPLSNPNLKEFKVISIIAEQRIPVPVLGSVQFQVTVLIGSGQSSGLG